MSHYTIPSDLPVKADLISRLKRFLEVSLKTNILDSADGTLKMYVLHLANSRNEKIKDKMIRYKLLRLEERLLTGKDITIRDAIVSEFLLEELEKYISSQLPSPT